MNSPYKLNLHIKQNCIKSHAKLMIKQAGLLINQHFSQIQTIKFVHEDQEDKQKAGNWFIKNMNNKISWPRLKSLHLKGVQINFQKFQLLQKPLQNLKQLKITQIFIEKADLQRISFLLFKKLKVLDLSSNGLDNQCVQILVNSNLTQLQILNLSENKIYNRGILQLSKGKWPNLKSLNLSYNKIGSNAISYLYALELNKLEKLIISHCGLSDKDFIKIRPSNLPSLKEIDADYNSISVKSFVQTVLWNLLLNSLNFLYQKKQRPIPRTDIFTMKFLPTLKQLNLSQCSLTSDSIQLLANAQAFNSLQKLYLGHNLLDSESLRHLSHCNLQKLRELILNKNYINDNCIKYFLNFTCENLIVLQMNDNLTSFYTWLKLRRIEFIKNPPQLQCEYMANYKQLKELIKNRKI